MTVDYFGQWNITKSRRGDVVGSTYYDACAVMTPEGDVVYCDASPSEVVDKPVRVISTGKEKCVHEVIRRLNGIIDSKNSRRSYGITR